jgi:DNA-binding XRE family transcriptional regulator
MIAGRANRDTSLRTFSLTVPLASLLMLMVLSQMQIDRQSFGIIGDTISLTTKAQLRAGRALLGWPQATLAERAGVSLPTIKRLEPGDGLLSANHQTVVALQRALENAGVVFTNGNEPGVKLKPR